jgi:hypothetical protein
MTSINTTHLLLLLSSPLEPLIPDTQSQIPDSKLLNLELRTPHSSAGAEKRLIRRAGRQQGKKLLADHADRIN